MVDNVANAVEVFVDFVLFGRSLTKSNICFKLFNSDSILNLNLHINKHKTIILIYLSLKNSQF